MKLVHPKIDKDIEFIESSVNVVVIENQVFFRELIETLTSQLDGLSGQFTLSKELSVIDIEKICYMITDPLYYDVHSRKINNKIQSMIKNICVSEEYYIQTNELLSSILKYGNKVINEINLPLTVTEEIDVSNIIKILNIQLDLKAESILERIENTIDILVELNICQILIFVNLKCCLTTEELITLYRYASYKKIFLLLLENTQREKLENEILTLIDNDLCLIA